MLERIKFCKANEISMNNTSSGNEIMESLIEKFPNKNLEEFIQGEVKRASAEAFSGGDKSKRRKSKRKKSKRRKSMKRRKSKRKTRRKKR